MKIQPITCAALFAAITLMMVSLSACGGDSDATPAKADTSAKTVKADEPKLENEDIKKFFEAISSSDPDKMEQVKAIAAPGSVAAAYLQEQSDVSNSAIDAGEPIDTNQMKKTDDGYENCPEFDDTNCATWGDFESINGKLAKFTINDIDISDRISVGDGSKQKAKDLASIEFLSAYKSVQSEYVFVNIRVTSHAKSLNLDTYSATYRGTDKRQTEAANATGPTELEADSIAHISLVFKAAKIGGVVKLNVSDEDYNSDVDVEIKTG